jgi:hypothetical protein
MYKLLISLFLFFQFTFYSLISAQTITDMGDSISVTGNKYLLIIQKQTAEVKLKNNTGLQYTKFPLTAYATKAFSTSNLKYLWETAGSEIGLTAEDTTAEKDVFKANIKCYTDNFEVQFSVLVSTENIGQVSYSQDWGILGLDVSVDQNTLTIGGNQYPKGLGTHANSEIIMQLGEPYLEFLSEAGVDDEVGNNGSVVFQVFTDDSKVYDSGILEGSDSAEVVEVSLQNVEELKLIVTNGGDNIHYDHADWALARLVKDNGDTIYISDWIRSLQEQVNIFCSDQGTVNRDGWIKMFTPEPDVFYYDDEVGVDLLHTRDNKRHYAPAPLNLSFQTPAGWFSVGLCELPDATRFIFKDNYFFIDYTWSKMNLPSDTLYSITPLCFTFNEDEWQGIRDYRNYLLNHDYIVDPSMEERNIPQWWMEPLVCTWGEQGADHIPCGAAGFNTEWVENYVNDQEEKLGYSNFTLIIDDMWQKYYGDPNPDPIRFKYLRTLIDDLHSKGHHVMLWWKCWAADPGSLPDQMGIADNGLIDATHPDYVSYVQQCMYKMLSGDPGCLNADGFKLDYIFVMRDPATASGYADPSKGMGLRELYRYMDIWYSEAKKIKPECLITFSGPAPHFAAVQDMSRLNDGDRTHSTIWWQNRARISILSAPNLLIDGDGLDMYEDLIFPHLVTSSVYGVPSLYFLSEFADEVPIEDWMLEIVGNVFSISAMRPPGKSTYLSPGRWQMHDYNERLTAESMQNSTSVVFYPDTINGYAVTVENQSIIIPLHGRNVTKVLKDTQDVDFIIEGDNLKILSAVKGQIYNIKFAGSTPIKNNNLNQPKKYGLYQNYPNPFNPETLINYNIGGTGSQFVALEIYNLIGQKVKTLVNQKQPPGEYKVDWDGTNNSGLQAPTGIYFYKIKTNKYIKTKKMLLMR